VGQERAAWLRHLCAGCAMTRWLRHKRTHKSHVAEMCPTRADENYITLCGLVLRPAKVLVMQKPPKLGRCQQCVRYRKLTATPTLLGKST
jgi:hypothetical protein